MAKQLLDALDHLHNSIGIIHGLITPESLVWSGQENVKLTDWPINLLTGGGVSLGSATILPVNISFLAPEQVKVPQKQSNPKSDIWSASLALLKLLKPECKLPENPTGLAFCDNAEEIIKQIGGNINKTHVEDPDCWNNFFARALEPNYELRGSLEELYSILGLKQPNTPLISFFEPIRRNYFEIQQEKVSKLDISEIYYLWRLSIGRNLESEQKQDDCPPIFKIPYLIVSEKPTNSISDVKFETHTIINTRPKLIPLEVFRSDMGKLDEKIFAPLILTDNELRSSSEVDEEVDSFTLLSNKVATGECNNNRKASGSEAITFADLTNLSLQSYIRNQINESSKLLPIVIKEADCAYQCERIVLFKRLLAGCPYLKTQLKREASIDIPPYYRAQVWAILLDVSQSKAKQLYETIDKTTPVATDRQISVDIPRCHQYNELMASPQGHHKLARILKAWLNHNAEEYVYWQGLDSLAAPFLLLNFHNEAMAFACFDAFIDKYLRGFFKKDNQIIVQQYLAMFSELLSYHDPALATHLEKLGFLPNLYAIPWFLTMFTHVLPLHKILHVWDCLLLGDSKFPLCIGLAILNQLKHELLEFSFNDCIVSFSNLPEIDIERCIRDASQFYNSTPDKKWR